MEEASRIIPNRKILGGSEAQTREKAYNYMEEQRHVQKERGDQKVLGKMSAPLPWMLDLWADKSALLEIAA